MGYPLFWIHEVEGQMVLEFKGADGIERRITKPLDYDARELIEEAKRLCDSKGGVAPVGVDRLNELIKSGSTLFIQMEELMSVIVMERENRLSNRIKRKIASIKQAIRAKFGKGGD